MDRFFKAFYKGNKSVHLFRRIVLKSFNIHWHGSHLGHVISIMIVDFFSLYLKEYVQNVVENGHVASEKVLIFICK